MNRLLIIIALLTLGLGACAHPQTKETDSAAAPSVPAEGTVREINQQEFAELVAPYQGVREWQWRGQRPAVVDFNATWCGPCRKLAPTLKSLAADYAGRVDFYSVDVDNNRELSQAFGVSSIPMLLLCPSDGSVPQAITGYVERAVLEQAIAEVLLGAPAAPTSGE